MKSIKQTIATVLCLTLVQLSANIALAGDGGSGDSPIPGKFSKNDFSHFGQFSLRKILKQIFGTIEMRKDRTEVSLLGDLQTDGHDREVVNSLREKLFSRTTSIYQVLETATLNLDKHECISPIDGQNHDGYASTKTNTVCISYDGLTPKLSNEAFALYVVALAAHEYSHLVFATEEEAKRLQQEIIDQIRLGDQMGVMMMSMISHRLTFPAQNILSIIDSIQRSIDENESHGIHDEGTSCSFLNAILIQSVILQTVSADVYYEFGVFAGGPVISAAKVGFDKQYESLQSYCSNLKGNDPAPIDVKSILVTMRREMSLISNIK